MQRVRIIPGADIGAIIPGDHDWYLASITGKQAKIQTLSLGEGVYSLWVPWSSLEVVANDVTLPGANVKALTELDAWCNKYNVSILATTTINTDCPTLWELINNATS